MTKHDIHHTGTPVHIYPDPYNIGQRREAEIALESGRKVMAENYFEAFRPGYVMPEWRAMRRRLFYAGRAEFEQAKAVLEVLS